MVGRGEHSTDCCVQVRVDQPIDALLASIVQSMVQQITTAEQGWTASKTKVPVQGNALRGRHYPKPDRAPKQRMYPYRCKLNAAFTQVVHHALVAHAVVTPTATQNVMETTSMEACT